MREAVLQQHAFGNDKVNLAVRIAVTGVYDDDRSTDSDVIEAANRAAVQSPQRTANASPAASPLQRALSSDGVDGDGGTRREERRSHTGSVPPTGSEESHVPA